MLTREKLNELKILTKKVDDEKERASELMRIAKDRFGAKEHKLERENQKIKLTEKILWDEVFYLGAGSQAGRILAKEHPEVFEAYKRQDEAAENLYKFSTTELGIDYKGITLSDYLSMTEQMFSLLLGERNGAGGSGGEEKE